MNAGIIPPQPGYLDGVRRLTRRYGVLLTFDEVKTGLSVHPGGATGLFGVTPDIVCLAKALGGGLPCGAIGGTHEVMAAISDGRYDQVGTFNGNPMTMAAARAMLTEVLTDEAYGHAAERSQAMFDRSMDILTPTRCAGIRVRVRVQGLAGVQRNPGTQLSRVPGDGHRAQPSALPRATQRWGVHGAVGQERAMDDLADAHRPRCRPILRQRSSLRVSGPFIRRRPLARIRRRRLRLSRSS